MSSGSSSDEPTDSDILFNFWAMVLDPDEDLWLFEEEDDPELERRFPNAPELLLRDTEMLFRSNEFPYDLAKTLRNRRSDMDSHNVQRAGRLAHLDTPTRLRFITWLFIVVGHCMKNPSEFNISTAIRSWKQCINLPRPASNQNDISCCSGCSEVALELWLQTMLQVYTSTYLALLPWGSPCNCLHRRLAACSPSSPTMLTPKVLHSLHLRTFTPAWPSLLWVLFCMMKTEMSMSKRRETFLSLVYDERNRDILIWDNAAQDVLFWHPNRVKAGAFKEDWYRYANEIDHKTWAKIAMVTRVTDYSELRLEYGHDFSLRIRAWYLVCSASMDIPPILFEIFASAFNLDDESDFHADSQSWTKILNIIHQPTMIPTPLLNVTPAKEFWNQVGLDKRLDDWLNMHVHYKCNAIWHAPGGSSIVKRVELMADINYNIPQVRGPYVVASVYKRLIRNWPQLASEPNTRYTPRLFSQHRSDFQNVLDQMKFIPLEVAMGLNPLATIHSFATDLHSYAIDSLNFVTMKFVKALQDRVLYDQFLLYRDHEAQEILDFLQDLLDIQLFSGIQPFLFKAMLRLSRASRLYPRCFTLTGLQKIGKQVAGGGYGDIWKGLLRGQSVCIKMMRIFQKDDIQIAMKEFGAEALIWRQLCHPNLLPFFGLYFIEERLCLISPWMDDGNIMEYLKRNSVDQSHRISMILDVVLGLEHLHKQATIHGDLKGINILVTPSGRACIADFGLTIIVNAMTLRLSNSTTINRAGTARYQAPELVEPESNGRKTFHTDIYALACVCYEILTGKIPFYECSNEIKVMMNVMAGKRPSRPSGTEALDCLWELIQRCWNGDPTMRPSATEIVGQLTEPKIGATTTSSTTDWDHEFTAQFRRSLNMEPLLPSVNQLERMIFGAGKTIICFFWSTQADWCRQRKLNVSTVNSSSELIFDLSPQDAKNASRIEFRPWKRWTKAQRIYTHQTLRGIMAENDVGRFN
ncbi:kinase domain-containing protein [Favolaschia claudopus]|uniref:Kinase domain-containing protein n=1 Tax=Favolaschia claudopus TaxID=2862362 RepID=A0AAV9ZVS3_9AGAR